MRISLRKLAVFDAVARNASVSLGAEQIAISQSAASMALKELEEDLGTVLFQRIGRKLILNENGRRLQPLARSVLAQAHEIERLLPDEQLSGALHLIASDNVDQTAMGEICAAFARANPAVQINLELASVIDVLDAVEHMKCDLGFVEAPVSRPGLNFEALFKEDLVVFTSPHHPLASRATVRIADLSGEQWCMRERGNACRSWTLMLVGDSSSLSVALTANRNDALKAAVQSGLGIGCLPRSAIRTELADATLVALKLPELTIERVFGLISPKQFFRGGIPQTFRSFALQWFDCPAGLESADTIVDGEPLL
jgi:DNA-binding transcriptional LysR family regulator